MKVQRIVAVLIGVAALSLTGMTAANAKSLPAAHCSGGNIPSGKYASMTVTGNCVVPNGGNVDIEGWVKVAPGAALDASTHSKLTVDGSIWVGRGGSLMLGCTQAHPCDDQQPGTPGSDTVGGNVVLDRPFMVAINGVSIRGNFFSNGGGTGAQGLPYSIKDDTIGGSLTVMRAHVSWFGVIRSTIGGTVYLRDIDASDPDANEVVANTIGGNLGCVYNSPKPKFGDAVTGAPPGYGPNHVGGSAWGQCKGLAA